MGIFKKGQKEENNEMDDFYYIPLNNAQLRELHIDVMTCGGHNKYLEHMKVVNLDQFGGIKSIIQNPEVSGKRVKEGWEIHYKSDILYETWSKIMDQLSKYEFGIEQGKYDSSPGLRERVLAGVKDKLSKSIGLKISE